MTAKAERERQRQVQEKCQAILAQMLREEDNKYCVDCDAKGPRWASWNIGIFLCIRCAGIHRNLGVHISKVKSVNLDTWTPEQVACLQQMGNSKARAVYEANLPDNWRRPQTDSSLEAFVRSKYEQKKYIAKEWVQPPMPKPAFNIEEDRKKEKERKRTRGKGGSAVEIPTIQGVALPRPHCASSNTSPTFTTKIHDNTEKKPSPSIKPTETSSFDLLGLDGPTSRNSDDIFDSFLSAAPPSNTSTTITSIVTTTTTTNSKDAEESNFFNQVADSDNAKKNVMSKESILSLYGAGSAQPQQSVYGVPGGLYMNQPMYVPTPPCIGGVAAAAAPMPVISNGVLAMPPQANAMIQQPATTGPSTNPFLSLGNSGATQEWNQQPSTWNNIPPTNNGTGVNPVMLSHGFGQLQQQMVSLQLGNSQNWNMAATGIRGPSPAVNMTEQTVPIGSWPAGPQGQTLSTNLWQ